MASPGRSLNPEDPEERLNRNVELLSLIKKLDLNDPSENWIGPYAMVKTLGKGATGTVKQGYQRDAPDFEVAIKIVDRKFIRENPDEKKRIEREIEILKKIQHPYLMQLYDVIDDKKSDTMYMILEYLPGGELYDYMLKQGGRIPVDQAFRFFFQLIVAIKYMHGENVVHRDIKMENLLLDHKEDIKVADFGMSCQVRPGMLLSESVGSPHYACPEIIKGETYNGFQADVWSIGVVLYVLLSGQLPFQAESPQIMFNNIMNGNFRVASDMSPTAQDLVKGLLNKEPNARLTLDQVAKHDWIDLRSAKVKPTMRKRWEEQFPPEDAREGLHQRLLAPTQKMPTKS